MKREWVVRPQAPEQWFDRFDEWPRPIVQLLYNRGLASAGAVEAFLARRVEGSNPFTMRGITEGARRIREAIAAGEKIIVHGDFDADGRIPCQIDGGLKCFGHPIGASGLRMIYEIYLQLLGRAGDRQLDGPRLGLTHNLGGIPNRSVAAVGIFGLL